METSSPDATKKARTWVRASLLSVAGLLLAVFAGLMVASPAQAGNSNPPAVGSSACQGCCPTHVDSSKQDTSGQTQECVKPPVYHHAERCMEGHTAETVSVYNPNSTVLDVRVTFDGKTETATLKAHETHPFVFMPIKNGNHSLKIEYCVNGKWCELCTVIIKTWCPAPSPSPSTKPSPSPSHSQGGMVPVSNGGSTAGMLPVTGSQAGLIGGAGFAAAAAGVGLMFAFRRRRRATVS